MYFLSKKFGVGRCCEKHMGIFYPLPFVIKCWLSYKIIGIKYIGSNYIKKNRQRFFFEHNEINNLFNLVARPIAVIL